jgi:hypothetical protein
MGVLQYMWAVLRGVGPGPVRPRKGARTRIKKQKKNRRFKDTSNMLFRYQYKTETW